MFPSLETSLISLLSFITLAIFIPFKWISFHSKTKKNLPPSPQKLPIIGNLHQLGSSPYRSLQALAQKHGPLMLLHLGNVPVLVASSSEVIQEITKSHDLTFSGRPKSTITDILFYGCRDIAFNCYGEQWRKLKSIVMVQLLNNTRVKSFQQVREEEMARTIGVIEESCDSLVDLSAMFFTLSNNVVCRMAIGRTYSALNFRDLLGRASGLLGAFDVGTYIPWLSWIDRLSGLQRRLYKTAKEFDVFLEDVFEEHENKKKKVDSESDEGQDLLDILLDFQKDDANGFTLYRDTVKANIMDMFLGGVDTTSAAMVWAMSELIRHPKVMKKLQQEVTEIAQGRSMVIEEDLKKMTYLKAVIKESLRLSPPIRIVPRESRQDVKLMGYDIPARTPTLINLWALGRDPKVWEEPEEFRPERFLNSSTNYNGLNFEMLPFGAGRRVCPGNHFATAIMELALANVVYKFNLELPNGIKGEDLDMSDITGLTVHKKSPLLVMVAPRF